MTIQHCETRNNAPREIMLTRYKRPRNWFREHPVLGMNFVFWVIVHGVADGAFKGLSTVADVLAVRPPKGRESYTIEWNENAKDLPFFRMVSPKGPDSKRALSFSSLRHNFASLAQRECFKDTLRVHGIRGGVANCIDRGLFLIVFTQTLLISHSQGIGSNSWTGS